MNELFNAEEVFEMAEQIEREGAEFYRRAAEHVSERDVRNLFKRLALMEDDHERVFSKLRERLFGGPSPADWTDADVDAMAYLQSLVKGRIFGAKGGADAIREDMTEADVLRTAIGFEKESIAFYLGIKEAVPADLGRSDVDPIIREEMRHVTILTSELARVTRAATRAGI